MAYYLTHRMTGEAFKRDGEPVTFARYVDAFNFRAQQGSAWIVVSE